MTKNRFFSKKLLDSQRLNFDFIKKNIFDLFSAIQELSFDILKSIFGDRF